MRDRGEKIVMVTAFDALTAAYAEAAEVDIILVGDSLGMSVLGFKTTIDVTLEMMIHHCAAVARGASKPLSIGDMPFLTYKISPEEALRNAGRMVQEGGMAGVKLEGGAEIAPVVRRLVEAGIPVMGHLGLQPQSYHQQGGYRLQGADGEAADRIVRDARELEAAGAFSLVLELMPPSVALGVTQAVSIPTLGIGAGPHCSGQVLVLADILGLTDRPPFKMVRRYADVHAVSVQALRSFAADVRNQAFPAPENCIGE
jgi:3-methyl-2-oxobutanoate hydroxymethyltransferase